MNVARLLFLLLLIGLFAGCGGDSSTNSSFGPPIGSDASDSNTFQVPDSSSEDSSETIPEVPPTPTPKGGFPSEELFIQIIGPDSADHIATGSGSTYIAGTLFGVANEIQWSSNTGQTGSAKVAKFWNTTPITLVPGDNIITVRAIGDSETSEDQITITYNPGFFFDAVPKVRPQAFFTNTPVDVVVTISVTAKNVIASTVTLLEVDKDGNNIGTIGSMADTGDTTSPSCDEIQDDGVFSRCAQLQSNVATIKYLRVSLQVSVGGGLTTVLSPIIPIEIVEPINTVECNKMKVAQNEALSTYYDVYQQEVTAGNAQPAQEARAQALAVLQSNPIVDQAGVDPNGGIWTRFNGGIMGALNIPTVGYRGGGSSSYGSMSGALESNKIKIQSRDVLALSPFNSELAQFDETLPIVKRLENQTCPSYSVDGPHLGAAASLEKFRSAHRYGIVVLSGHGDTYFKTLSDENKRAMGWEHSGSQEILWTGEPVQCADLSSAMTVCSDDSACPAKSECVITKASQDSWGGSATGVCIDHTQIDLRRGRVVIGAENWGVHPSLFRTHSKNKFPNSLVYFGACRTLYNGTLASELFGLGATTIAGYTDYVTSDFAYDKGQTWFNGMLDNEDTTGMSMVLPVSDPVNPVGQFRFFGGNNLEITDSEIINPGFESGEATGWTVAGDGRVISRLGVSLPVGGKFMGVLSTGLGYTQQTGEMQQTFCIPEGKTQVSFYWKFFSEEFVEYCGDIFQDTFEATLEVNQGGQLSLVSVTIDDLCSVEDCSGSSAAFGGGVCGGHQYTTGQCQGESGGCKADTDCKQGPCVFGLVPSTVDFDKDDVYNTPWQKLTKDVTGLSGSGPVTLRLFATDTGDSIYDSAILVDSISFD